MSNEDATTDDAGGCRCMDDGGSIEILTSLSNERSCTTHDGDPGIRLRATNDHCIPLTYGATCAPHDVAHNPDYCREDALYGGGGGINCYRPWCYVADRDACMMASEPTTQRVYRSSYFDGIYLYWSYTVCDGLSDWDPDVRKQTLGGATILATTPQAYFPPYHYKRSMETGEVLSEPGEEYWNKSVPFEGAMIDYLDQLQTLADGDFDVEWTFGSKASKLINPSSSYTASVQDVEDGLIDMAVGPIWITGERLRMATYTVPLFYSPTVLIAPKPGVDDSMSAQTSKVLAPFETGVWLMIVLIIAFTAALMTWFSGESARLVENMRRRSRSSSSSSQMRGRGGTRGNNNYGPTEQQRHTTTLDCALIWGRLGFDACLRTGTYFSSAGIEQEHGASLPMKLLLFGYGAFILVVVSAYVANLAAFLTIDNYRHVGNIEEATRQGWKICALPAIEEELRVAWPDTRFVFSGAGAGNYHTLIEEWDAGKCKAILYEFANLELKNKLCERNLTITESVVMENPVAWPIRSDYAVGLSYWMYEAGKKYGLNVESLREEYDAKAEQPVCNVLLSTQKSRDSDEHTQISLPNLFAPFVFFGSFAIVALGLQLFAACTKKKNNKRGQLRTLIARNSTLGLMESRTGMELPSDSPKFLGPEADLHVEGASPSPSSAENASPSPSSAEDASISPPSANSPVPTPSLVMHPSQPSPGSVPMHFVDSRRSVPLINGTRVVSLMQGSIPPS